MWVVWTFVTFLAFARHATAEIYAYEDASGVTHFTNLRSEIPESERERARVVVSDAWLPSAAPAREAERVEARKEREERVSRRERMLPPPAPPAPPVSIERAGGTVQIQGPLAVAVAEPPVVSAPPAWVWVPPGLVTTAFDRGRSRHRTLRLLMEDVIFVPPHFVVPGVLVSGCPHPVLTYAGGPRYSCLEWLGAVR